MKILYVYTNINGQHADSFADGISMIMAVTKKLVMILNKYKFLINLNMNCLKMK